MKHICLFWWEPWHSHKNSFRYDVPTSTYIALRCCVVLCDITAVGTAVWLARHDCLPPPVLQEPCQLQEGAVGPAPPHCCGSVLWGAQRLFRMVFSSLQRWANGSYSLWSWYNLRSELNTVCLAWINSSWVTFKISFLSKNLSFTCIRIVCLKY